jgi:hypothetical protein
MRELQEERDEIQRSRKLLEQDVFQKAKTKAERFKDLKSDWNVRSQNKEVRVEPGDFKVWIGPNAESGLEGNFKIKSTV